MPLKSYRSWGACGDCGFQGLMEFVSREDEDYEDENALGVMMDTGVRTTGRSIGRDGGIS